MANLCCSRYDSHNRNSFHKASSRPNADIIGAKTEAMAINAITYLIGVDY